MKASRDGTPRPAAGLVARVLLAAIWFELWFFAVFPLAILLATGGPLAFAGRGWLFCGAAIVLAAHGAIAALLVAFVVEGRGTQVPLDPPRALLSGGLYARTRNPMYLLYTAVILGEAIAWASPALLAYAACFFGLSHVYVTRIEEPRLRERFGARYDDYCRAVPRWLPSRPWRR